MSIKTILSLSLLLTSTSSLKLINPKVLLSSSSLSSLSSLSMSTTSYDLVLDPFGKRQFNNKDYMGTQVFYNEIEFEKIVNEYYNNGTPLIDGYAPFCKHLFIPNFANVLCGYAKITSSNSHLIKSCYDARTPKELPVLVQYFDKNEVPPPLATHLDIILYSRDQIIKENIAMGETPPDTKAPWGIISVKGQLCDYELPMQPITMMRNALGKDQGGSGVPLDSEKYQESVAFWKENCAIK